MQVTRKLRTAIRLKRQDKLLVMESALALLYGLLAVKFGSAKRLSRMYGDLGIESGTDISPENAEAAHRIRTYLRLMRRYVPWKSNCRMDAVAAKLMLNRRHISSTVYIGFRRKPDSSDAELEGHAWLRSGRVIVMGGPVAPSYQVVARYGTEP